MERARVLGDVDPATNLGRRASLTETPKCPGRTLPQIDCFLLTKRRLPMKRSPLLGREPCVGRSESLAAPEFVLHAVRSCVLPAAARFAPHASPRRAPPAAQRAAPLDAPPKPPP